MRIYKDHLILSGSSLRDALELLNELGSDAILFVVDSQDVLMGSLTDGDVRRALLKGCTVDDKVDEAIETNPKFIIKGQNNLEKVIEYREGDFKIVPVVDGNRKVLNVINFRKVKSYLPVDAVVMAGGKGQRLHPLTLNTPKPLLKVGEKPIMEHNIDRLVRFGIDDFWVSVKYLGEQIENYFGSGDGKNIRIEYVWEKEPLGTIGAVSKINNFEHDYILVTNSDLLTNLDYEHFFLDFLKENADVAILTIPYQVNVPYAVLETKDGFVASLKEKPTYTYYSNGGVYLMKKEVLELIPKNKRFDAPDLIEQLIKEGKKVKSFPFSGYWLDVGKHEDFEKAQIDIKSLQF